MRPATAETPLEHAREVAQLPGSFVRWHVEGSMLHGDRTRTTTGREFLVATDGFLVGRVVVEDVWHVASPTGEYRSGHPVVNRRELKRDACWKVCSERYGWCFVWADSPAEANEIVRRGLTEKCPYCEARVPADNLHEQKAHMEAAHPEIIEKRLREAGFVPDAAGDWTDTLVDGSEG